MKNKADEQQMEIREIPVFVAGWFFFGLHAFWSLIYVGFGYLMHWFAGAKEPNVLLLLTGLAVAWTVGATTALVFNLMAKLVGGIRIRVSITDSAPSYPNGQLSDNATQPVTREIPTRRVSK